MITFRRIIKDNKLKRALTKVLDSHILVCKPISNHLEEIRRLFFKPGPCKKRWTILKYFESCDFWNSSSSIFNYQIHDEEYSVQDRMGKDKRKDRNWTFLLLFYCVLSTLSPQRLKYKMRKIGMVSNTRRFNWTQTLLFNLVWAICLRYPCGIADGLPGNHIFRY